MRSVIIDDEPLAAEILESYLKEYPEVELVAVCKDGFEGLRAIRELKPDLVFLDIQMPKITGFELLELIDEPLHLVFTTAYDNYALKAFESNAIDYLLKPFNRNRFDQAMQRVLRLTTSAEPPKPGELELSAGGRPEEQQRVVVKNNHDIRIIPVSEIDYIEAYDDYVKIYTGSERHLKKKTLSYFEETLNPKEFVRVHRSCIIRIESLATIESTGRDTYNCVMKSGVKLAASRTGYNRLREVLRL